MPYRVTVNMFFDDLEEAKKIIDKCKNVVDKSRNIKALDGLEDKSYFSIHECGHETGEVCKPPIEHIEVKD